MYRTRILQRWGQRSPVPEPSPLMTVNSNTCLHYGAHVPRWLLTPFQGIHTFHSLYFTLSCSHQVIGAWSRVCGPPLTSWATRDEMRTALRTLAFLPPSWGRLSRPLSDISLIWSAQEFRPRGTAASRRASPIPPQLPPRARPPSKLLRPATPSVVLPPPFSPGDGKGEGGTTIGTAGTVTFPTSASSRTSLLLLSLQFFLQSFGSPSLVPLLLLLQMLLTFTGLSFSSSVSRPSFIVRQTRSGLWRGLQRKPVPIRSTAVAGLTERSGKLLLLPSTQLFPSLRSSLLLWLSSLTLRLLTISLLFCNTSPSLSLSHIWLRLWRIPFSSVSTSLCSFVPF